jgi:hypothetical protein
MPPLLTPAALLVEVRLRRQEGQRAWAAEGPRVGPEMIDVRERNVDDLHPGLIQRRL